METACFAMGCFWGAERVFWSLPGVLETEVGYTGGRIEAPTYEEVCRGRSGHAEAVLVQYDPEQISYSELVDHFLREHDPTQGMRQGPDVGEQYRSAIFAASPEQAEVATRALQALDRRLEERGLPLTTTQLSPLREFYRAEEYHQRYLEKNPGGYCGLQPSPLP